MPSDDMPPEPIVAMLAQLEDETAHMTPAYLDGKLAELKARYAALPVEERIRLERRAEIAALTAEANRQLAIEPHERPDRPILHEESAGPLRWHTCAGCGRPWPCPDAPPTEREQDRMDEYRLDATEDAEEG